MYMGFGPSACTQAGPEVLGQTGSSGPDRKFRALEVPGRVRPKPKVGTGEGELASGGRKFRPGPEVPGRFRAKQKVGMPWVVDVEGGRKFEAGRKFRGPKVPGVGSSGQVPGGVES